MGLCGGALGLAVLWHGAARDVSLCTSPMPAGKAPAADQSPPPKKRDSSAIKKEVKAFPAPCQLSWPVVVPDPHLKRENVLLITGWWHRLCAVHHREYRQDHGALPTGPDTVSPCPDGFGKTQS